VSLISLVRDDLRNAQGRFEESLDLKNPMPFSEVTSRLVAVIEAYRRGVSWMNQYFNDYPAYLTEGPYKIPMWEEAHEQFATDMQKVLAPRSRFPGARLYLSKTGRKILPP
jgi:hypothetical protein